MVVSGILCSFLKEVNALVLYDVEHGIPITNDGERGFISSCFGYTELLCIPEVTSVFFLSCDSVLCDSLVFLQAN